MAHILIIDDHLQMRELLRDILEHEGHTIIDASDGKMGIRLHRAAPADLIITDIVMPEKEGLETIMDLRRDFPNVKIIAISGGGQGNASDYLVLAKTLGARFTFVKPFKNEELIKAVRELLDEEIHG